LSEPEVRQPLSRKQLGEFHFFAKHDGRKGHHYYTTAPQAEAGVYSSDDPCGHHGVGGFMGWGTSQKYELHPLYGVHGPYGFTGPALTTFGIDEAIDPFGGNVSL